MLGPKCFRFSYHMSGRNIERLDILLQVRSQQGDNLIWQKIGDQGNKWIQDGIGIGYTGEFQVENKKGGWNCQKDRFSPTQLQKYSFPASFLSCYGTREVIDNYSFCQFTAGKKHSMYMAGFTQNLISTHLYPWLTETSSELFVIGINESARPPVMGKKFHPW